MLSMWLLNNKEVILMDFEGDFDDLFDMDVYELAFALGMAETIGEEEREAIRAKLEADGTDGTDIL